MNRNYHKELLHMMEQLAQENDKGEGYVPTLFLHCCCAPCSSQVWKLLASHFRITAYYYNPNIFPMEEYQKRKDMFLRLPRAYENEISFEEGSYDYDVFLRQAKGLEGEREGGSRCERCYRFRLEETAQLASARGFDYFTTTLSISPHKNGKLLNEIGEEMGEKYHIKHLPCDFKKQNGYIQSVKLSEQYGIYRQTYCGCQFSLEDR